ncbi:MAG: HDOD domain-containing protein [Verrucomicrobiota bacterium]
MSSQGKKSLSILIVDDDPNMLAQYSASSAMKPEGWLVRTAKDGVEGVSMLKSARTDIIVTALNMAQMNGSEVLAAAKRESPNSLRFLYHGTNDKELLTKATGLAHQYLESPSPAELARSIRIVLMTQLRIRKPSVAKIVRDTKELHVNTEPMQELLRTADDPECDIECLSKIISKHPTAVATALQVANTAFFGAGGRIETIEEALQLLGMDFVRNLAVTELAKKQLALPRSLQEIANAVLQHSIQSSQYGFQMKSHVKNVKLIQTLCSLALLHDLGKLVFLANDGNNYADVLSESIDRSIPAWRIEQSHYGCDHAAVGGFLFAMWGLPEIIIRSVTWHHEALKVSQKDFCPVSLLHYSNAAAHLKNEMAYYCGDVLDTELSEKQELPNDYARDFD